MSLSPLRRTRPFHAGADEAPAEHPLPSRVGAFIVNVRTKRGGSCPWAVLSEPESHVWLACGVNPIDAADITSFTVIRAGRGSDPLDESDHRPRAVKDGGGLYRHGDRHWHLAGDRDPGRHGAGRCTAGHHDSDYSLQGWEDDGFGPLRFLDNERNDQ